MVKCVLNGVGEKLPKAALLPRRRTPMLTSTEALFVADAAEKYPVGWGKYWLKSNPSHYTAEDIANRQPAFLSRYG